MKGVVIAVNPSRGLIKVRTTSERESLIEIVDCIDIEYGYIISGNLLSLGGETLYCHDLEESFEAYIQDID